MKKSNFIKRMATLLMVCVLFCSLNTIVFAATNDDTNSNNVETAETSNTDVSRAAGNVLYAKTARIYNGGGSVSITTDKGNFNADFIVSILGNPSGGSMSSFWTLFLIIFLFT